MTGRRALDPVHRRSSHVLTKAVATLMDDAGLPARALADQLGHSKPSMTMDNYFGRGVTDTGAAAHPGPDPDDPGPDLSPWLTPN